MAATRALCGNEINEEEEEENYDQSMNDLLHFLNEKELDFC